MPLLVPDPPHPIDPAIELWPAGTPMFRVHAYKASTGQFRPTQFNPGPKPTTRFAFFGSPAVPVLYAGASEETAVAETIFHDIPITGGRIAADSYRRRYLSEITALRDLQLAQLHSGGLRTLKVKARRLIDTEASQYLRTVRWAAAIHQTTAVDGLVWMSRHWNSQKSVVLFGDRVAEADLTVTQLGRRVFASPADVDWLNDLGQRLHIDVLPIM